MAEITDRQFASIDWTDPQNPRSMIYNDIYFSSSGGEGETVHTFINGNCLEERFRQLPCGSTFIVAETGFGTGSNLLILLNRCLDLLKKQSISLTYISFEKYPLSPEDMLRAHSGYTSDIEILPELLQKYQNSDFSRNEIRFTLSETVSVRILLGDISCNLEDFSRKYRKQINAWFLDGYSPSRNPDLWTGELFEAMQITAAPDCTLATYTVSGAVRRGLAAAGFAVEKTPGYGRKKEMTRGRIKQTSDMSATE